jgi:hypothetical protein
LCQKSDTRKVLESLDLTNLLRFKTLKEVAEEYGVSISVVSQIASDQFKVVPEEKNKIVIRDTIGAWMDSEERIVSKYVNAWQILKETNLYKELKK